MNLSKRKAAFALLVALSVISGCGGTDSSSSTSTADVPSLQIVDNVVGTGATAMAGNTVAVNYTGWLYSASAADHRGAQFDSSVGKTPFVFKLGVGQVIAGWDQGVGGMKVGGNRTLIIPSSLGYGSLGTGPIPPNTALVFTVDLLAVQ